ncbi:MAG: hypothetical protein RLZ98_2561 [Pseudomonadota bacterium]|jgi:predicted  nucleic acid-binding Zn-ribbon protein
MAQKNQQRVKSSTGRKAPVAKAAAKSSTDKESLASLRRERDALRVRLAESEKRLKDLEDRQQQVIDRIDWVIDSLATVSELEAEDKPSRSTSRRN